MAQLVASMSGVVLGGVVEVVGSNLARGKLFTASIGSVDSLYPSVYIYLPLTASYSNGKLQKISFFTELTIFETIEIVSMCYSATIQTKFSRHPRQKTPALSPAAFGPRAYSGCWHSKIICKNGSRSSILKMY